MTNSDKAIEILSKTKDGDILSWRDLWLVQEVVNGHLNENGLAAFEELYQKVINGKYVQPWFHGIEHLTQNHKGYVFWKGKEVEHYSFRNADDEKKAAKELARRCQILEERGMEVNATNAVWNWKG